MPDARFDPKCSVCGEPVRFGATLCHRSACRWKLSRVAEPDLQSAPREDRRAEADRAREDRAAREQRCLGMRDELAAAAGVADPQTYVPTVIPLMGGDLVPRDEARVGRLRDHLAGVTAAASGQDAPIQGTASEPDEGDAVMGAICGRCGGWCCREGGDHAYLRPDRVREVMAELGKAPDDIVDEYTRRVPAESVSGSCVFHGPAGCGLPRAMRSHTCNAFLCTGVKSVLAARTPGVPLRGYVVSASPSVPPAFIDEWGVREVSEPPSRTPEPEPNRPANEV